MDYTTLLPASWSGERPAPGQMHSLYTVCQELADGRKARGKRYHLAGVLMILILAKLAGMRSVLAVSEWADNQHMLLCSELGLSWKRMPCANTYHYVLARLDSQQVNATLAAWFVRQVSKQRCGNEPSRLVSSPSEQHIHLAIDGKTLKSTGDQAYGGEHPQQHLLHVYEVETGIVLHQVPISLKTNEVGALKPLLTETLCKGRVITVDAAQSYHGFLRRVKRAGGEGIVLVKDNTPATRADLALFFEDEQADRFTWGSFEQWEKGHGRIERRWIQTSPDLNGWFSQDWGEIGQVFRVQRERTIGGKQSCEVAYGLTTLSPRQCGPERLLAFIRAHWKVENHLHWRRDALLGEDGCRVRCIPAMEMLAVLNTVVLSLMNLHHVSTVARQLRRFAFHPQEALPWLLSDF